MTMVYGVAAGRRLGCGSSRAVPRTGYQLRLRGGVVVLGWEFFEVHSVIMTLCLRS